MTEAKQLAADARFNPAVCARVLADDLESGELVGDRLVAVVRDAHGDIQVRASGPGMGDVALAIGTLQIAIGKLSRVISDD